MAKLIHCATCAENYALAALKTGELYEPVKGISIRGMLCDGCAFENYIKVGDQCWAACLLPDRSHRNYQLDKPSSWMDDYITSKKTHNEKAN